MTDTKTLLNGPRSKIELANRHIDVLRQRSVPLDKSLYELSNPGQKERRSVIDRFPTRYRVTFRPKQNIPETFAVIIGDAFNNIREACDYTAAADAVTRSRPPPPPRVYPNLPQKQHD